MKIENRCPWCGEVYQKMKKEHIPRSSNMYYCEKCGHLGKWKIPSRFVIALIGILLFVTIIFDASNRYLIIASFWGLSWLFIIGGVLYPPVYRYTRFEEEKPPREISLCEAKIHWYSSKEGGIWLSRIRLISGVLFPICFVDENDIPTSQVGVVRLVKRYGLFWKGAEVFLITDFIKPEAIEEGQKFYIFNEKKRIGEGIVTYK